MAKVAELKKIVYSVLDKHECVGEEYHEFLMSKENFTEVMKSGEYDFDCHCEDEYGESGLKMGVWHLFEVNDDIDPWKQEPLCSCEALSEDFKERDHYFDPTDDQVVVEIIRTMKRFECDTHDCGLEREITLTDVDPNQEYGEGSISYAITDIGVYSRSQVRGLLEHIEFGDQCLFDAEDHCPDLERPFDPYFDTIEYYVRDSKGNRTKLDIKVAT